MILTIPLGSILSLNDLKENIMNNAPKKRTVTAAEMATETKSDVVLPETTKGEFQCTLSNFAPPTVEQLQETHDEVTNRILKDMTDNMVYHTKVEDVPKTLSEQDRTMRTIPAQWRTSFEKRFIVWALRHLSSLFNFSTGTINKEIKLGVLVNLSNAQSTNIVEIDGLLRSAIKERDDAFFKLVKNEAASEIRFYNMEHDEHANLLYEYDDRDTINERVSAYLQLEEIGKLHGNSIATASIKASVLEALENTIAVKLERDFNMNAKVSDRFPGTSIMQYDNEELLSDYITKRDYVQTLTKVKEEHTFGKRLPNQLDTIMLGRITTKVYLGIDLDGNDELFLKLNEKNPMYGRVIAAVENVDKS